MKEEDIGSRKQDTATKGRKPVQFLAASCWKEPRDKVIQWRSSLESDNRESGKCTKFLNKYKYESVCGPQFRSGDGGHNHHLTKSLLSPEKDQVGKLCYKEPEKLEQNRIRKNTERRRKAKTSWYKESLNRNKNSLRSFNFDSANHLSEIALKGETKERRIGKQPTLDCQTCMKRNQNKVSSSTQTDFFDEKPKTVSDTAKNVDESVVQKLFASSDLSLHLLPQFIEPQDNNSFTIEESPSISFEDDEIVNFCLVDCPSLERTSGAADVLQQLNEVQKNMQRLEETMNDNKGKVRHMFLNQQ